MRLERTNKNTKNKCGGEVMEVRDQKKAVSILEELACLVKGIGRIVR